MRHLVIIFYPIGRLFAVVDDIFCLFQGHIENVAHLKQQYGLNKIANEVIIVIEAYRTLRDRGPYPPDQVVSDIHGKFAFVLYDSTSRTTFLAAVSFLNVLFFSTLLLKKICMLLSFIYWHYVFPDPLGCTHYHSLRLRLNQAHFCVIWI